MNGSFVGRIVALIWFGCAQGEPAAATWTRHADTPVPADAIALSVSVADRHLWVLGNNGRVWSYRDSRWEAVVLPQPHVAEARLFRGSGQAAGSGWVRTADSRVFVTTDDGAHWREVRRPAECREAVFSAAAAGEGPDPVWMMACVDSKPLVRGPDPVEAMVYMSRDSGANWRRSAFSWKPESASGTFAGGRGVLYLTGDGELPWSTDRGQSWKRSLTPDACTSEEFQKRDRQFDPWSGRLESASLPSSRLHDYGESTVQECRRGTHERTMVSSIAMARTILLLLITMQGNLLLAQSCIASGSVVLVGTPEITNSGDVNLPLTVAIESADAIDQVLKGSIKVAIAYVYNNGHSNESTASFDWKMEMGQRRTEFPVVEHWSSIYQKYNNFRVRSAGATKVDCTVVASYRQRPPAPSAPQPSSPRQESRPQREEPAPTRSQSTASADLMTNGAIVKLHNTGLGDDLVIARIDNSLAAYDLEAEDLVVLKAAGLSNEVIKSMMRAQGRQPSNLRFNLSRGQPTLYLVQEGSQLRLEAFEATMYVAEGYEIFRVPGPAAVCRTRSRRPTLLVPSRLARSLELYDQAVQGGARLVAYSFNNQRQAKPIPFSIQPAEGGWSRLTPTRDLPPGEYALTPNTSNTAYVFGID